MRKGEAWWLTHDHLRDFAGVFHLREVREDRRRKATPLSDEAVEQLFLPELSYWDML